MIGNLTVHITVLEQLMDINAYFQRIGYEGAHTPTLETLRALHRAHMLAVPFENLDIHLGRPIRLDKESLFEKLVRRRRGGFCYEQNGLFALVLRELGFDVTLMEARVTSADGSFGIPFDHLALRVQLEERWLVDVGFGDSFLEPLRLDTPREQYQNGSCYLVTHDGVQGVYSRCDEKGELQPEYQFFLQPRELSDFLLACDYHQTSPDSPFTNKRVCSLATPQGRITLSDYRLIVRENGSRSERLLGGEDEITEILGTHFGVTL